MKIGISVYSFSVTKNGVEKLNLNDLIDGKGLFEIFIPEINSKMNQFDNDPQKENLFSFYKLEDESIYDGSNKLVCNVLYGQVKTGEYGISSELVDVNTGETYNRTKNQADILPFGFCILVAPGQVDTGVLVMQSIGRYGIKMTLQKHLQKILQNLNNDFMFSMGPITPKEYIKKYFEKGILQKISMIRYEIPEDLSERYGVNYGVEQTVEERIIHRPIGFLERRINEINEWIKGQRNSTDIIKIDDFEYDNLKFVFKLGNNVKTINLNNLESIVITEDITDKVVLEGTTGLPTFGSIKQVMRDSGKDYLYGMGYIVE